VLILCEIYSARTTVKFLNVAVKMKKFKLKTYLNKEEWCLLGCYTVWLF
jgi:hypothetical protein